MFKITEGDFKNQTYGDESYLSNWPMLYILENGKQAYIGESNHVKNRMSQHHSSVDKRIFDKVHFIYSSRFNQSVTFDYVKEILSGEVKSKKSFANYNLILMTDFTKFNNLMYQKEKEVGLVRMAAGYAWDWLSKNDKTVYDIEIQEIKKQWNHCTEGWVHSENAIDEVGCIHSIQGYDLNYAFIILGDEIGYDPDEKNIIIRAENYFDQNGKKTAEYEELKEYIQHIYYVLMTRGIRGTYLYVSDPNLRDYISRYVDVE
ncbi:DNA/RNA helicase domain-containing protein [Mediterraneibacter gnavus]|uniref:GIY-YIG catalytic domain protein n=1 Tax=Mediterraneibacter gnavus (strain ATCC 29149 / DSM 114966 / JCM 6515 / VPI C7-9) TaxID=411470 RepID=A7AYE2_MEDG7|nr:DNA/RNA helicase domain-containing protein [Mediterraneibacter gnavus]EDN79310.1 GIY-YIG catalytic domain protein [Mediterraneibacter gnavus ATCC 29149]PQL31094.1 DUF2075 domain-containing protein [Mediterraneibacter gnavus ATCC 29149]QEI33375.1 DUF2075 domain-containing protein [Mediterraneibacter gnavus ATCC 29149]QHB22710.1 DUF2075 domain-containing protein [Mediterraneibacter gnavus ATCC 29149]UZT21240.1 DUF2075 domain-containing protein [Mediterraneibacter gnavus]